MFPPGLLAAMFAPRPAVRRTLAGVAVFTGFTVLVGVMAGLAIDLVTAVVAVAGVGLLAGLLLFGSALNSLVVEEGEQ